MISPIPMKRLLFFLIFILLQLSAAAQLFTRKTYHDKENKNIKEIYQVKDTSTNILQGRYISYYLNGNIESKGQFSNNETTGVWEFYYETGNLRMRGILRQNSNYGLWEYFYENGQKSMEGTIDDRKKEGVWKIYYESGELKELGEYKNDKRTGLWTTYFEDGTKRGDIEYSNDHGRYTEYYHSGKILSEGPKVGARNAGHWKTYTENGALEGEGDYEAGKKNGDWKFLFPSGKISSEGKFENDEPAGQWIYYYEDGKISSKGSFVSGKRNGYWVSSYNNGALKSEITYTNGAGDYREYYPDGKLKVKGQISNGKNQGKWQYFYEDGKQEGECDFDVGKGTYFGYYPTGNLQTKGRIEDDLRVGTWELYEQDGKLSGYYKPFYEDKTLSGSINALIERSKTPVVIKKEIRKRRFDYFSPRYPEYHSVILQGNPAFAFLGSFPIGIEFYNEARLGHEFGFEGLRDPFFTSDSQVPVGKIFNRGYAISLKQKFYNPVKLGMWYVAHEIRFTNLIHNYNIEPPLQPLVTVSAPEQRVEYALMVGMRLMEKLDRNGFTIDTFVGYGVGYRNVSVDQQFKSMFSSVSTDPFSQVVRFGLNFGYSFSFEGR